MSVTMAESQLRQAHRDLDRARDKQAGTEKRKLDLETAIRKLEEKVARASSDSTRRSYESQMRSKQGQLNSASSDLARAGQDLVKTQKKVAEREGKLAKARADEERRARDQQKRQRQQQERRQRLDDQRRERKERQEAQKQARRERQRDQEISALGRQANELAARLAEAERDRAPAEITVVFLAASPLDQNRLQIGPETREIRKRIRASEHRDAINVEWLLGRQLTDLIDDLGQVQADVFHFSGHSDESALVFETDAGGTAPLTKEQLGRLIKVSGRSIRLAVFNSCDSAELARSVTAAGLVEVAVGMMASIGNDAAKVFAGQFYGSIGNGHSLAQAFEEAKLQLDLAGTSSEHLPELFVADGVDAETVVLVNPDRDAPWTA